MGAVSLPTLSVNIGQSAAGQLLQPDTSSGMLPAGLPICRLYGHGQAWDLALQVKGAHLTAELQG